jgi:hypothetical protein
LTGGTNNKWNTGDAYAVWNTYNSGGMCNGLSPSDGNEPGKNGYPCKDQIGRTTNQVALPTYLWNNNYKGNASPTARVGTLCNAEKLHIVSGRNYFDNTLKPGYSTYICPHPLAGKGNCITGVAGKSGYVLQ